MALFGLGRRKPGASDGQQPYGDWDEYGGVASTPDDVNRLVGEMRARAMASATGGPNAMGGSGLTAGASSAPPASNTIAAPKVLLTDDSSTMRQGTTPPPAALATPATSTTAAAPTPPAALAKPSPGPVPVSDAESAYSNYQPKVTLPDYNSLPGAQRVHDIQSQMDALNAPHSGKQKFLDFLRDTVLPIGVGAATGNWGAGMIGAGMANKMRYDRTRQAKMDLVTQLRDAESEQNNQFNAAAKGQELQAQLESNKLYRDAVLGNRGRIANDRNSVQMMMKGLHPDGTPMTEDELPPQVKSRILLDRAHTDFLKAQQDYEVAKTNNMPEQMKQAEDRMQIARGNMELHRRSVENEEKTFEANYFGTVDGKPLPGGPTDENGNPIGLKTNAQTGPTAATRAKMEQGNAIVAVGHDLSDFIRQHADEFGPIMGRYNNFESFLGDQSPVVQQLNTEIASYISLHPQFHGMRGITALRAFEKAFGGFPTNAEALASGIDRMSNDVVPKMQAGWGQGTRKSGGVKATPPKSGGGGVPADAPPAPQQDGKVLKDAQGNILAISKGRKWVPQ